MLPFFHKTYGGVKKMIFSNLIGLELFGVLVIAAIVMKVSLNLNKKRKLAKQEASDKKDTGNSQEPTP
jgi:hypothetical protein